MQTCDDDDPDIFPRIVSLGSVMPPGHPFRILATRVTTYLQIILGPQGREYFEYLLCTRFLELACLSDRAMVDDNKTETSSTFDHTTRLENPAGSRWTWLPCSSKWCYTTVWTNVFRRKLLPKEKMPLKLASNHAALWPLILHKLLIHHANKAL
jgi:hypothetical protein